MSNPKRPEDRQRRNLPAVVTSPTLLAPTETPRPPTGLSTPLRRSWAGLWSSPVAALLDPVSDLPAVNRLFNLYTLGEQLEARVTQHMKALMDGDDADGIDDKLLSARMRVASETRMLESQLGLSPRSRLALGLALLAGRKAGSLDDAAEDANE
jgi:hypothetical protein